MSPDLTSIQNNLFLFSSSSFKKFVIEGTQYILCKYKGKYGWDKVSATTEIENHRGRQMMGNVSEMVEEVVGGQIVKGQ